MNNVDEHVLHEIDDALQVDIDKEEILRKVIAINGLNRYNSDLGRSTKPLSTINDITLGNDRNDYQRPR